MPTIKAKTLSPALENFSSTYALTGKLTAWNGSKKHPIAGFFVSRITGVLCIPLTCLIDSISHTILAALTLTTGIFVSPYNFVARVLFPKRCAPEGLELNASFVHIHFIIRHLLDVVTLPLIIVLDPKQAHELLCDRRLQDQQNRDGLQTQINALQNTIVKLEKRPVINKKLKEVAELKQRIDNLVKEINVIDKARFKIKYDKQIHEIKAKVKELRYFIEINR